MTAIGPEPAPPGRFVPAPRVMVGIATFNRAALLPKAISSAQAQDHAQVELAVLDDASTDETPQLRPSFPGVRWERREHGIGIVEARNYLMRSFTGEYFAGLDDDAWFVGADELRIAVAHLESHPRVAAIAFDILSPDRPGTQARSAARQVAMYIGCGHLLRMSAVRELGFYEATPGKYGSEEKDLCLRMLDAGWEVHFLPGAHVWHEKTVLARDLDAQHRSGVCNDLSFALRRCPFPAILGIFPYKLASHAWWSVRHRRLGAFWRGAGDFFRNFAEVSRARNPVRLATFWRFSRGFRRLA